MKDFHMNDDESNSAITDTCNSILCTLEADSRRLTMHDLEYFGHHHQRKLVDTFNPGQTGGRQALCHFYDILVKDDVDDLRFLQAIASASAEPIRRPSMHIPEQQRRFVKNDERRDDLINEFICTEESYVASLDSFIKLIVSPVRARASARGKRVVVLGPYECSKIFMNIEGIRKVSEEFCKDLSSYVKDPQGINFGELCLKNLRGFGCYDRYLKGVESAQAFNKKEQKRNVQYQMFLDQVKGLDKASNQTVYDYLALPGQRVGRYTMFFKELIKHTMDGHPDLPGLTAALSKAEDIANMAEDYHTKLIRIFHNMLQSIQHCPHSLISEQRKLVCHLDAVEVDPRTLKPVSPVTFFLFTDKLMVVRRPSYSADGLELCGLDHERDKSGMVSLLVRKTESGKRAERKLKFRGWLSLGDIDVSDGVPELPASLSLVVAHPAIQAPDVDPQSRDDLDGYFQADQIHLFTLCPPTPEGQGYSRKNIQAHLDDRRSFAEQFGKTRAKSLQTDDMQQSTYYYWRDHHFFGAIYPMSRYHLVPKKNEMALIQVDSATADIRAIFGDCYTIPHVLGFIQPQGDRYLFSMRSKLEMGASVDETASVKVLDTMDDSFDEKLFGNLLLCDNELHEIGRQTALAEYYLPQNGPGRSVRRSLRLELNRRRSTTTFKLFPALGSISSVSGVPGLGLSAQQRPRSISVCGDYGRSYSSGASSIRTHGSNDSRTTLHSISSSLEEEDEEEESPSPSKTLPSRSNRNSFAPSNDRSTVASAATKPPDTENTVTATSTPSKSETDVSLCRTSSLYRSSAPPARSMSCEVKPQTKSTGDDDADLLEERVNVLCAALSQGLEGPSTPRPARPLSRLSRASSAYSSTDLGSGFSTIGSRKSAYSTLSSYRGSPLPQDTLSKHSSVHLDRIFSDMDQVKADFDKRWSTMVNGYDDNEKTTQTLQSELQKKHDELAQKEEELAQMQAKYKDAMDEIDLLYESFNDELDHISHIVKSDPSKSPSIDAIQDNQTEIKLDNARDSKPEEEVSKETPKEKPTEKLNGHADSANADLATHEDQLRKKLDTTLRERNHWHQTARKLARELKELNKDAVLPKDIDPPHVPILIAP